MRPLLVVLLLIPSVARPQTATIDYEKILVPLTDHRPSPGANGSLWSTTFAMFNSSHGVINVEGFLRTGPFIPEAPAAPLPVKAGVTFRPPFARSQAVPGAFLFVERSRAEEMKFSLRAQDLSRQFETWGTQIPVARENDFAERLDLLDIPQSADFRMMLRIYDFDGKEGIRVRIAAHAVDLTRDIWSWPEDRFLGETEVTLRTIHELEPNPPGGFYPAYAQISDLASFIDLDGESRIRLQVESLTPGARIWGFVSVTNNETQHVTIVSPQ